MIEFDATQRSVVAVCACGAREIAWSSQSAYDWAAGHLRVCTLLTASNDAIEEVARRRALAAVRAGRHRYR